ncbi:MAG: iron chaperone [Sphingobacteriales bacterium]
MSRHNEIAPKTIDEYIAMQPDEFVPMLHELRAIIKSIVPQATESISYMVPCFKYHYMLVGIGVTKKYCSLYVMSTTLGKTLKEELKGVKMSGTTIHFPPNEPLPVDLVKRIVTLRMQYNEQKAMLKK